MREDEEEENDATVGLDADVDWSDAQRRGD